MNAPVFGDILRAKLAGSGVGPRKTREINEEGIDEVQRTDLRETRRMTKRRALFSPEVVLQMVRFPVSEVPLYRGELYDTYRVSYSLIRHTCSRRTLR
jgi:hypothetical protein